MGYKAEFRLFEVNSDTWADGEHVGRFTSASIERALDDEMLERGSFGLIDQPNAAVEERYYRLVATLDDGGGPRRVEIATMYCPSASGTVQRGSDTLSLEMYSTLYPASTAVLTRGTFVQRGDDGVRFAAQLLGEVLRAPVEAMGGFTIDSYYVFDVGSTYLEAVKTLLGIGGYRMRIGGNGTVTICPAAREASVSLDASNARLIRDGIPHSSNRAEVPNRYIAVLDGSISVAENRSRASETSTVRRGYNVDMFDGQPALIDGETLEWYARRKLEEASVLRHVRTYKREWVDGVYVGDIVSAGLPRAGLQGDMRVQRQSISCANGMIEVQEQAAIEEMTWQA